MWDAHERALNRLARTFTTQVGALERYRSKGAQKGRSTSSLSPTNEGGKAIVGSVSRGEKWGIDENGD